MSQLSQTTKSGGARLRLRLAPSAEMAVRSGHPWVYAERIREISRAGISGEIAIVYDRKDRFMAFGLFDPDSPIRLRILHSGPPMVADEAWWQSRMTSAVEKRTPWFQQGTDGYRLVNGESDGWPALILDRYGSTLVLKLYSAVWLPRMADLQRWIVSAVTVERIVLRLSRNVQDVFERAGYRDGQNLVGIATSEGVIFQEDGLLFWSDVVKGQKTGFFLDQRENRRRIGALSVGAEVLNAFSFSGGFSLHAARGGAVAVTDLDCSPHALEAARRNFQLNHDNSTLASARHQSVQADAFDWLENGPGQFDVVICDPPSLARREHERAGAIDAYRRLATSSAGKVRSGGLLLTASCSAHVLGEEFHAAVTEGLRRTGRRYEELEQVGHALDHPTTFAEARYLKAVYLRMLD